MDRFIPLREWQPRPLVSWGVIAICCAVFVVWNIMLGRGEALGRYLLFSPGNGLVWPNVVLHMFTHFDQWHLLGNMLTIFFLGFPIERRYGHLRYLVLFLVSGLLAAAAQASVNPEGFMLGASGAASGIMAAFLRHHPTEKLYLYGVLPVPTWIFVPGWIALNLLGAQFGQSLGIAFLAHVGGFFAGLGLSFLLIPPRRLRQRLEPPPHLMD